MIIFYVYLPFNFINILFIYLLFRKFIIIFNIYYYKCIINKYVKNSLTNYTKKNIIVSKRWKYKKIYLV